MTVPARQHAGAGQQKSPPACTHQPTCRARLAASQPAARGHRRKVGRANDARDKHRKRVRAWRPHASCRGSHSRGTARKLPKPSASLATNVHHAHFSPSREWTGRNPRVQDRYRGIKRDPPNATPIVKHESHHTASLPARRLHGRSCPDTRRRAEEIRAASTERSQTPPTPRARRPSGAARGGRRRGADRTRPESPESLMSVIGQHLTEDHWKHDGDHRCDKRHGIGRQHQHDTRKPEADLPVPPTRSANTT